MTIYVWRDNGFVHKQTGEPMYIPEREGVCCPRVESDLEPYRSPVDGRLIGSRSEQRDDLARNGCVLAPPSKRKGKGYRNPDWAVKRGLPLSEEARDRYKLTNKHVRT
jgi:hypothetical protein